MGCLRLLLQHLSQPGRHPKNRRHRPPVGLRLQGAAENRIQTGFVPVQVPGQESHRVLHRQELVPLAR